MSEDLSKRPRLLIISDTAVYINDHGEYLAFEPVVREIEHFAHLFSTITWLASRYKFNCEIKNVRKVTGVKIQYVLLPAVGGPGFSKRLKILWTYIRLAFLIPRLILNSDVIHSRGPSHPALIAVLFSILFFRTKVFWHKYAGDWSRKNDPFSYRINKYFLKKAKKTKVTVNGKWQGQKSHILSFENPCITEEEWEEGLRIRDYKQYSGILDFIFVGNHEDFKGIPRIIEAFSRLKNESRIGWLHFVGDGSMRKEYEKRANEAGLRSRFHGFLAKGELNKLLMQAHVMLLPSESEGFPKVVAEGANYGCILVVSDISCLSQYIKNNVNGFIMPTLDTMGMKYCIDLLISMNGYDLKQMALEAHGIGYKFTYNFYNQRIIRDILNSEK